jgi:hypothetical protein
LAAITSPRSSTDEQTAAISFPPGKGSNDTFKTVTVEANCALKTGRRLSHRPDARAVSAEALALPERALLIFSLSNFSCTFPGVAEPVSAFPLEQKNDGGS